MFASNLVIMKLHIEGHTKQDRGVIQSEYSNVLQYRQSPIFRIQCLVHVSLHRQISDLKGNKCFKIKDAI